MNFNILKDLLISDNLFIESNVNDNFFYHNLTYNSKEVTNNTIFICKGINFKKKYLKSILKYNNIIYISEIKYFNNANYIIVSDIRKAMALISKHFYLSNDLYKIGITGTKGKTTTVYFLHNILNTFFKMKTPYLSTIDYYTIKSSGNSSNTTPESLDLYKYFKEVKDSNFNYIVLEVSSLAKKYQRIYQMPFNIGAITNIKSDHISLYEHDSYEDYFNSKLDFLKQCDTIFIYNKINHFTKIKEELINKKVITYGYSNCDYIISDVKKDEKFLLFKVNNEIYKIMMQGEFNILNACLAIAISKELNIDYNSIYKGLLITKVSGRMEYIPNYKCLIIIDYAHNKLSLETVIMEVINSYLYHKIILVGGIPGDKNTTRITDLQEVINKYNVFIYLTMDNPKYEKVSKINKKIAKKLKKNNYKIINNRKKAIFEALNKATINDIIIIFGKGSEQYQIIKNKHIYYEGDAKVVSSYLDKKTSNILKNIL